MNSLEILNKFVEVNNLKKNSIELVKTDIKNFYDIYNDREDLNYDTEIIEFILTDLFKLNNENLKLLSDKIISLNLRIGRRHKKIILNYLNYKKEENLIKFFIELKQENNLSKEKEKEILKFINNLNTNFTKEAYFNFLELWEKAEKEKDNEKIREYLFGIFSRIYKYYNNNQMSLLKLFNYNKQFIKGDLKDTSIKELEEYCKKYTEYIEPKEVVHTFYEKYIKLLKKELQILSLNNQLESEMNQKACDNNLLKKDKIFDRTNDLELIATEEFNSVYLTLNQKVFDRFKELTPFYNYVLNYIKQVYRVLENNKVFAIEIDNIYYKNKNLKWELYAYLGIFSERFIKTKENKPFFKPENICFDMFELNSITLKENINEKKIKKALKYFYKHKTRANTAYELINTDKELNEFKEFIEQWQNVFYGFTFNDCIILKNENKIDSGELNLINNNHILLIFYKYRIDNRKIPCPICGGLNISGNSYPEIGHRSWECKNIICSERSKSNRGKRYSFKSNYMQYNAKNPSKNNNISKDLISKWRKDIVTINSSHEIYEMFIKYFSFENEKILFINSEESCLTLSNNLNRKPTLLSLINKNYYESKEKEVEVDNKIFNNYFKNGEYINRFLINKDINTDEDIKNKLNISLNNIEECELINGDSFNILNNMDKKIISSAVTSPPYYNAREYSQWPNLYLYLVDMFNIIKASKNVLKDDGIFLYNIGDINGNENTIVKSNMGNKRLLLGAYSILLFKNAGFELVDNLIWDKGEPQSNRSTNDGNFTPHYQKPINAYEHMFIFKKKGKKIKINENDTWTNNIIYFSPVIKINLKGKNTLGHTAPFPLDIPDFVAKKFNSNPKDIMLDPFSGSGTTIKSAVNNNIKGLGIELSEEYVKLTKKIFEKENKKIEIISL